MFYTSDAIKNILRYKSYQALTPAPITDGASGSSGHRGRGLKLSELEYPDFSRSIPAQAIIAALSVQRLEGGTTSRMSSSFSNFCIRSFK